MRENTASVPPVAEQSTSSATASALRHRIIGYDVARSLALLGMIVVHFGLVLAADPSQPTWAVAIMAFLDGRAAATFVVLAGVGLTLRSRRAAAVADADALAEVRRVLVRRGVFLLAAGLANLIVWPGIRRHRPSRGPRRQRDRRGDRGDQPIYNAAAATAGSPRDECE
jgi:hypothetical protein